MAALYGLMNTEEFYESEDYTIGVNGDNCSISSCKRADSQIEFPNVIDNGEQSFDVTDIGPKVFGDRTKTVTVIVIQEGVLHIDSKAFQGCSNLKAITLPESLESIGEGSFTGCTSLKKITIPDNVKRIDAEAFVGCPLKELDVPAGLDTSMTRRLGAEASPVA